MISSFSLKFIFLQCEGYQPTPQCNKKCIDGYPISYEQDKHFGASAYAILPNQEQIQTEIQKNGPVVAIYMIFEDFFAYKSGVYQYTTGDMVVLHGNRPLGIFSVKSVFFN